MADRVHRFYVKPLSPEANEALAAYLNVQGDAAGTLEHSHIEVDDAVVEGVYEVPHRVLTELKRSVHVKSVRVYVQAGIGKIRPYVHFKAVAGRLARTRAVGAVKKQIAGLRRG